MIDTCGSGHYGPKFSMAEIVAALSSRYMRVRAAEPQVGGSRPLRHGGHAVIGLDHGAADDSQVMRAFRALNETGKK